MVNGMYKKSFLKSSSLDGQGPEKSPIVYPNTHKQRERRSFQGKVLNQLNLQNPYLAALILPLLFDNWLRNLFLLLG